MTSAFDWLLANGSLRLEKIRVYTAKSVPQRMRMTVLAGTWTKTHDGSASARVEVDDDMPNTLQVVCDRLYVLVEGLKT